jgi:CoA-transferase family III
MTDERYLADRYRQTLLQSIGVDAGDFDHPSRDHPAISWALSGAMMLTGRPDQPARMCPAPLAACADGALDALTAIAGRPLPIGTAGHHLLGERAAIGGFRRSGAISAGGSCHLLRTVDGWLAINLTRQDDWDMVPAWLGHPADADWNIVSLEVELRLTTDLVDQGRMLGLAIAPVLPPARTASAWHTILHPGSGAKPPTHGAPLVLDFSGLWAGPLCGHLLQLQGARIIKIESLRRPDGARQGPAEFYDLMNAGKESAAFDLAAEADLAKLRHLIDRADIVIESSRPRALRQLGFDAAAIVEAHPGLSWISITGYGREEPESDWVAFGDDAGVAAGLSAMMAEPGEAPVFCGDAIADPLTGLHAALIAWARWQSGRGGFIALSLHDVTAHCAGFDLPQAREGIWERIRRWTELVESRGIIPAAPCARLAAGSARPLGADTAAILSEFGIAC